MMRCFRPYVAALSAIVLLAGCAARKADYTEPAALSALIQGKTELYLLVDVRTAAEYAEGHIPTAVNIPVGTIGSAPPTTDKSALIIVTCRSGSRSATAKATLEKMGYTRVLDFGGISRWTGPLTAGPNP